MGKSRQPKVRHRMERPCVVFRELQVVNALGVYCWSVWCARGQVGAKGLRDVPGKVGGGHSPTGSRSKLFQTHALGGLEEMSLLIGPVAQRAGLAWLGVEKGEMQKINQTSLYCEQGGLDLGGARLGELERDSKLNFFPARLVARAGGLRLPMSWIQGCLWSPALGCLAQGQCSFLTAWQSFAAAVRAKQREEGKE